MISEQSLPHTSSLNPLPPSLILQATEESWRKPLRQYSSCQNATLLYGIHFSNVQKLHF